MIFDPKDINTIIEIEGQKQQLSYDSDAIGGSFINGKASNILKDLKGYLEQGGTIHFISHSQFDLHQLIRRILDHTGPAEVLFTTYAIKEFQLRQLRAYKKLGLVISYKALVDYRIVKQDPKVYQYMKEFMQVAHTNIHAKMVIVKGAEKGVSVITSANFTKNLRIEAGVISCRQQPTEYLAEFIERYF